jgi:dynein regulatory complex protein 1
MHVEEVQELVDKTLLADKIITEQQLGWKWAPPPPHLLPQPSSGRGKDAKDAAAAAAQQQQQQQLQLQQQQAQQQQLQLQNAEDDGLGGGVGGGSGGGAGGGGGGGGGGGAAAAAVAEVESASAMAMVRRAAGDSRVKAERISRMLDLLAKEASFLVSADMRASLDTMASDRKSEVATSAILKALGVEDDSDVNSLLSFFFDHDDEDDEDYEDELAPLGDLGIKVKQDDIIKVINQYVKAREADEADEQQAGKAGGGGGGGGNMEELGVAKKPSARKIFWQSLANVVPDRTIRVWEQLENTLSDYTRHLEGRAESLGRVSDLRKQNEELKRLLNQYLHADVNSQLHVPPTQTIRLGDI